MGIDVVNTHYICQKCSRRFIKSYSTKGYSQEVKEHCLKLYVHGMGFRGIERATGVNHSSVINWVKQAAKNLPNAPDN
ncbi:MAG: hypothetical protein KME05_24675 [Gloeocapsa sp. UFS-A4-WI-NPMV-4B04]|jgi:transposase-like protein|nr:hypothetical protein [Gloeocapsa sp. UFS-A4-WI-NPMV-4B04]